MRRNSQAAALAVSLFCVIPAWCDSSTSRMVGGVGAIDFDANRTFPALSGSYTSITERPGVFNTRSELEELAKQINVPGSYSAGRFRRLAAQVGRYLSARNEWGVAYSGCNSDDYTYAFSYEFQTTHNIDHSAKLNSDLGIKPGSTPPAGAAVVASKVALYAALVKAGAEVPKGGPSPDQASSLAKKILLAWSLHGFQDGQGHYLSSPSQFCGGDGKPSDGVKAGVGLMVSRGIIYSAQAQDLLMYLGALNDAEVKQANAFHAAMYELIRNSLNFNAEYHAWTCDHYGNHTANQLAGLLALARLLDNQKLIEAALNGRDASTRVNMPWVMFFDRAIYGYADLPNACYPNKGADGSTSKPFYQTAVVAPGEIDDRYRNSDVSQGIGYSMFTLERLYDAAEILRNAGYDSYGYHGLHGQAIETATAYYACYGKTAGFANAITVDNSSSCPDATQYYGKIVNGVDRFVTIGALRFPENKTLAEVESAAKTASSSGPFSLDAILFGKWRVQ